MMESVILQQLRDAFPTSELQQARLTELISTFGHLDKRDMKFTVGDILCLAKLLYENGDRRLIGNLRIQVIRLEQSHEDEASYLENLAYLNKCLASFKPAIFKSIQTYFSELYGVNPALITCLPKIRGQQIGATVEIKRMPEDVNPIIFHVKTHHEFCSKSDPNYIAITSDGTGKVDFKELFIYKVLEYIGYGPKTHFIVDSEIPHTRIEEGVLIATQELGYTKKPDDKKKSFKTFREVRAELISTPIDSIDERTKRDVIVIDMLSRAFLLEDVMINQGNFGMASVKFFNDSPTKIKWRILDFIPPKLVKARGDDYSYGRHYPGGVNIFYSFKVGNISHTYDDEELDIVNQLLSEDHAGNLWSPAIERLSGGWGNHLSVSLALDRAFEDVRLFMTENEDILQIKPDRMERRMQDLAAYQSKIMENFSALASGIREYVDTHIRARATLQPE